MPTPEFLSADVGGIPTSSLVMFALMGAILYFLVLRPQQQEAKQQAELVASLQKGDRVVTTSGLHGKVHEARGDTLVLEISANSYLTVDRDSVKRKVDPPKPDGAKPDPKAGA